MVQDELAGLRALPDEEWEPCEDLAGQARMRPKLIGPEAGDYVYRAEQLPLGMAIRPDAWVPGYLRFDPAPVR